MRGDLLEYWTTNSMTIRREMRKFEVVGRGAQSAGSDSEVVEAKPAVGAKQMGLENTGTQSAC
jgi:hypothetical protein